MAARKRDRLAMCFESFEEAIQQSEQQTARTTSVRKSPVGNFENMGLGSTVTGIML